MLFLFRDNIIPLYEEITLKECINMKVLRGLYLWICYILAVPLLILIGLPLFVWLIIDNKRKCGEFAVKDMIGAAVEGIVIGHMINMIFVNHGRKGLNQEDWSHV